MKRSRFFSLLLFLLIFCLSSVSLWAKENPKKGDIFPDIEFKKPSKSEDKEYLGLKGWGDFKIADIKAEVVIIELFSMYCPHCQAEAPLTRDIYDMIEKDKKLKGKFKIIGIGIKNSDFEVDFFRKKYKIPFPLISDGANKLSESFGKILTPHYVVVKMGTKGAKVIFSEAGRLEDPKEFLDMIYNLKLSEER
jgi:peroxiredoxin